MMSDGDVDIRILALRRQQQKRKQSNLQENNLLEHHTTEGEEVGNNQYSRLSSGRSAYETTPVKAYSNGNGVSPVRRNSFVGGFDEEARIGRMHVPPVIRCQCNGIETFALISTSETVSTISMDFVRKLRLVDQIQPEVSPVFNPLALHQPELKGKVKYVDLAIGNAWQQVAQFNLVETFLTDITLGIDFLRRTQSVVNFGDSVLVVGGSKGERIPLLTSREVMSLARRNNGRIRHTPLLIGTFTDSE